MSHEAQRTAAYLRAVSELAAILYDTDPGRMGRTVGAPQDEYEDFARKLLVETHQSSDEQLVLSVLRKTFPEVTRRLAHELGKAIARLEEATKADHS